MNVCSVFRCPVCRYCQTPEPVEENKCFECGVQEVTESVWCISYKAILTCLFLNHLDFHFYLSSSHLAIFFFYRTCGFVWSAGTSVVVATWAGMRTSTLRKHSTRTLCSSPTTVSGTTQEVLNIYVFYVCCLFRMVIVILWCIHFFLWACCHLSWFFSGK